MTRHDFAIFAEEIKFADLSDAEKRATAAIVIRACKRSNRAFKADLFLAACGLIK